MKKIVLRTSKETFLKTLDFPSEKGPSAKTPCDQTHNSYCYLILPGQNPYYVTTSGSEVGRSFLQSRHWNNTWHISNCPIYMRKGNKYRALSSIPGFAFTYYDLTYTLWVLAKNVHVIVQNSYTEQLHRTLCCAFRCV